MLKISSKYLILSLGEIILIEGLIILMINILIGQPLKLKKFLGRNLEKGSSVFYVF